MSFKLHPLHTAEMHQTRMLDLGVAGYHEWLAGGRGTGRTFAQALRALADAVESPGKPIHLTDHSGKAGGDQCLAAYVRSISAMTGMQHIHVQPYLDGSAVVFEVRTTAPPCPPVPDTFDQFDDDTPF